MPSPTSRVPRPARLSRSSVRQTETTGCQSSEADKFSLLTADWKPSRGEVIRLMKRADGKFIEIERLTAAASAFMFPADAVTPSLADAEVFSTAENTKATAITGFTDASEGVVYTIHGNGDANASTIANGGNFVLTAGMTLSTGSSISLVKAADGKFYEVERVVAPKA